MVDWTAYRSAFEQQASSILGHPVRVTGSADARLLPTPILAFTDVAIGEDRGTPLMTVGRFDIEVELFPLLSGEVRVTRMRLERPALTVQVSEDGTVAGLFDRAQVPVEPSKVVLDKVEIADGSITVQDPRRPGTVAVTDLDAALEARSLSGPWKLDGTAAVQGRQAAIKLSTGTPEADGSVIVKATVDPADRPVRLALDGKASVAGLEPRWTGTARLERLIAEGQGDLLLPWWLEGKLEVDPTRLRATDLEYHYGPEDWPFSITGAATVDYDGAAPRFEAVLSARQLDLDRTLGKGPDAPVAFADVLAALSTTLPDLPRPPIEGRLGFDIPGIVVGGSVVQNLRLDLATAPDGWQVEAMEADLPGRSSLAATGRLRTDGGLAFSGTMAMRSDQPTTLVSWWYPTRQKTALGAVSARALVDASADGLTLRNLEGSLGTAAIGGEMSFTPGRVGRRPALALTLDADRLAVEEAAAVIGLMRGDDGALTAADMDLKLTAATLTAGDAEASEVNVAASLVDGTLSVERLTVRDLAGARLTASGTVSDLTTTPDGTIEARIVAADLGGVAALAEAIDPGSRAARMLASAAPVLAPADLSATVSARAGGDRTALTLRLVGTAGGSTLDGRIGFDGRVDRWADASLDAAVTAEGPNGIKLMRQLGFEVEDVGNAGLGRLVASVKGVPADGLDLSLDGALGTTTARLSGSARLPGAGDAEAHVTVALASADVGPLLALSGQRMADLLASTPVDLAAKAALRGSRLSLTDLAGTAAGQPVSGEIAIDFTPAVPAISGRLDLEAADLATLMELAFGPGTMDFPIVASRSPWPEAPFGPGALDDLDADLALSIGRVAVTEGLAAEGVRAALRSSASGIGFDGVTGIFAGGKLTGSLVVKRDLEGEANVSGQFALDGAAADSLAWRVGDRAVVDGRLDLDAEFAANGRTVAGLVASLSGGGNIRVADGTIRSMNPQAFDAVVRAFDAGQEMPEDRIRDVFTNVVDAGDLAFERIEGTFTLAGGTLRAPSLVVTGTSGAETTGSATLDLPKQTLQSDWRLAVAGDTSDGPVPQVGILFRGNLFDPDRRIDVAALSSFLSIRGFERETQRVLVMQADILERELLSRQVLRVKETVERERRDAEEARRAAEEEAARRAEEEEAARRAAEELLGPAPDVPAEPPRPRAGAVQPVDDFADLIRRRLEQARPPEEPLSDLPGVDVGPPPGGLSTGPLDLSPATQ